MAVVFTQPQNVRGWSSGVYGCCEDMSVCCYGLWCPCCMECSIASKMGENPCGACCWARMGFSSSLRTKIRTQFGIRGSVCRDTFCTFCSFTSWCAICQHYRELKQAGFPNLHQ